MPRTMWKGAISFGLVTIPVGLYPATEEKTLRFNQLHDEDHGRIKYKRVCAVDGEEVPFPLDPFARRCLTEGIDELEFLRQHDAQIAEWEARHA